MSPGCPHAVFQMAAAAVCRGRGMARGCNYDDGASNGIRTRDLYLTKVTLYQAELSKHVSCAV